MPCLQSQLTYSPTHQIGLQSVDFFSSFFDGNLEKGNEENKMMSL